MPKNKILISIFLIISIIALSCSSNKTTGKTVATEPDIFEDAPQAENQTLIEETAEVNNTEEQVIRIRTGEEFYNELINDEPPKENINIEEFKFSPDSIVNTQHNISLSLDKIKHEIKSDYWGKIIGITATVLNNSSKAFKPKLLVLMYDEKDFKEEWLKPKAEIDFDIEKLGSKEHLVRDAIVNIAFDDIALTKQFKLVLVDATDPANKPIVVVEKEFNSILG